MRSVRHHRAFREADERAAETRTVDRAEAAGTEYATKAIEFGYACRIIADGGAIPRCDIRRRRHGYGAGQEQGDRGASQRDAILQKQRCVHKSEAREPHEDHKDSMARYIQRRQRDDELVIEISRL